MITFGQYVFSTETCHNMSDISGQDRSARWLERTKKRRARIYLGTRDSSGQSIEEGSPAERKEPDWWQRNEIRQETVESLEGRSVKDLRYYSTGQLRASLKLDKQKTVASFTGKRQTYTPDTNTDDKSRDRNRRRSWS